MTRFLADYLSGWTEAGQLAGQSLLRGAVHHGNQFAWVRSTGLEFNLVIFEVSNSRKDNSGLR